MARGLKKAFGFPANEVVIEGAKKTRIVWNGQGGELDSVTVRDDGEYALSKAIVKLVQGHIVTPGDSFTVDEVE